MAKYTIGLKCEDTTLTLLLEGVEAEDEYEAEELAIKSIEDVEVSAFRNSITRIQWGDVRVALVHKN